ncbi:hypothetical protein QBC38DRAFT_449222 [Podospora fimiseda]|uniref:Uncharacterized protein n=1 Tax=Podospora fimiseda TaxID=252190 RepID=A0AAN7BFC0_9PEZI|nr:hypothetical protein QBC38DRAFT_449222 [Podospora fimiseda]
MSKDLCRAIARSNLRSKRTLSEQSLSEPGTGQPLNHGQRLGWLELQKIGTDGGGSDGSEKGVVNEDIPAAQAAEIGNSQEEGEEKKLDQKQDINLNRRVIRSLRDLGIPADTGIKTERPIWREGKKKSIPANAGIKIESQDGEEEQMNLGPRQVFNPNRRIIRSLRDLGIPADSGIKTESQHGDEEQKNLDPRQDINPNRRVIRSLRDLSIPMD